MYAICYSISKNSRLFSQRKKDFLKSACFFQAIASSKDLIRDSVGIDGFLLAMANHLLVDCGGNNPSAFFQVTAKLTMESMSRLFVMLTHKECTS